MRPDPVTVFDEECFPIPVVRRPRKAIQGRIEPSYSRWLDRARDAIGNNPIRS